MRVKLAAKMLVIAWTMMKNETAFNPELLEAPCVRVVVARSHAGKAASMIFSPQISPMAKDDWIFHQAP
jgi:hypothetical protein